MENEDNGFPANLIDEEDYGFPADLMENEDYVKSNREKRMAPKHDGSWWCDNCDHNLVANWEKCPECGHRQGNHTLKKETSA